MDDEARVLIRAGDVEIDISGAQTSVHERLTRVKEDDTWSIALSRIRNARERAIEAAVEAAREARRDVSKVSPSRGMLRERAGFLRAGSRGGGRKAWLVPRRHGCDRADRGWVGCLGCVPSDRVEKGGEC